MMSRWIAGSLLLISLQAFATELVYTPVNPSFGGNPINGSYLLSNAQAQNDKTDPDSGAGGSPFSQTSAIERFTRAVESRLLSDLLSNAEEGTPGRLETSDFIVDVISEDGSLSILIVDKLTNESTQIDVSGF